MSHVKYDSLPEHMRDGAELYVERGIEPGDFMLAVLCNNLVRACERADSVNLRYMVEWASWLKWECPMAAWGSSSNVDDWVKRGGLRGEKDES
jgi:hypothetical protein